MEFYSRGDDFMYVIGDRVDNCMRVGYPILGLAVDNEYRK